jgi:uncharacterized surface protein with fasciclin (FAS1) repeats
MTIHRSALVAVTLAAATALTLSSCSTETKEKAESSASSIKSSASSVMSSATSTAASAAPAALVGAGCAGYAEKVPTGPGSVAGLAKDPVATAAGNSPVLTTLNPDVNLVETLNGGEFTVFAPTDEAFAKLDPATIDKLKTDSKLLTSILTYHVVSGQAGPSAVVGDHKTVQGESVKVTGSGDSLKVNDAGVVCGGIKTANATLYLIDTVLTPPAAPATTPTP